MPSVDRPVLGLDIGGTKLAVGVVTADGAVHGELVEPTRREQGPERVLQRLFTLGHRAVADAGLGPVAAVGVSCGGPLDAATGVLQAPLHLPGWSDVPVVALAEDAYGVPAALENDATAAAFGEYRHGHGASLPAEAAILLYLTLSTGVGGGTVVGSRLHHEAAGNGGEFGHLVVRPGGRSCLCGRRGCLERYVSGTSIAERATEALQTTTTGSTLAGLATVRAEDVVAAAATGWPSPCGPRPPTCSPRPSPTWSTCSNRTWWCSAAGSPGPAPRCSTRSGTGSGQQPWGRPRRPSGWSSPPSATLSGWSARRPWPGTVTRRGRCRPTEGCPPARGCPTTSGCSTRGGGPWLTGWPTSWPTTC